MSEITYLTATEAAAQMEKGWLSAGDFTRACLHRIAVRDRDLRAFVHLKPDYAIEQARVRDGERRQGKSHGPLHGIPIAIKDIFDTSDFPTENGSKVFAGRMPERDSAAVARLREAGCIILGKTVTTECAYFYPGPTRNPHDPERTPGGSSSGSAAAVAAGMVPLAIGSQTNGSIIRPAAFCGVIGVKPTHGLISRARALVLSEHLDHVGVFANSLADAALALDVLVGADPDDAATNGAKKSDLAVALKRRAPEPRLAFVRTPMWRCAETATRAALENFAKQLGSAIVEIDLPERFRDGWPAHRTIMAADMARNLGPAIEQAGEEKSSAKLRNLLADGRAVATENYRAALEQARALTKMFNEQFKDFDAVLTAATIDVAPGIETTGDPVFCTLWSLLGVPEISLPILKGEKNLPLGVQLVGRKDDDVKLLHAADWLLRKFKSAPN